MSEEKNNMKSDSVKEDGKPTILFWVVSLLAIIWGAFSFIDYFLITSGNADYVAQLPPQFKAMVDGFPMWRTGLWFASIAGAVIGGILMLFRSEWAVPFLWLVPISMVIGFVGYDLLIGNGIEAYGTYGIAASTIMILISLVLALYAAGCDEDEILR